MDLHALTPQFRDWKTPFYYYDLDLIRRTIEAAKNAAEKRNYFIHYALKANSNERILKLISELGLGADCVSGNEILKALECGFEASDVAFAGVGKSDEEIRIALENDIFCFNCESVPELNVINDMAGSMGRTARVALRINPNVNARTHHYITTGLEENKFGINAWEFDEVLQVLNQSKHIELVGLHFHIGSQITDLGVFRGLCIRVNEIQQWFIDHHIIVDHINLGGGLGVNYDDPDAHQILDFEQFFGLVEEHLEPRPKQTVHFELGRSLTAQAGTLITRTLYVKKGVKVDFAIVDAGMTELIRPALYQAFHKIENLENPQAQPFEKPYDVVGPICESSDCFGKAVTLPETKRNDLIAIRTAGAYGEVLTSAYNLRSKAEVHFSDEVHAETTTL